jgi:tripartite-type tricarboxylate transporter receptor subunit TctC
MTTHIFRLYLARFGVLAAVALLAGLPVVVGAQDNWPSKPIRMVISFPPGSSPDVIGRAVLPGLSEALGQPIIADNRAGVGGILGSDIVAKAAPDGYTILITSGSAMAISVHTLPKLPFNPATDLMPVAAAARIELFLVARPNLPFKTYSEFIRYAKANPGKLSYGSPGTGSAPHIATEMLKSQAQFSAVHIPYKGAAPALQDLLGGVLDFAFDPGIALTQVKAGKLILLAVGSSKRSALLPDTPTVQELGLKDFDAGTTHAFYVPKGTPLSVVERLNREINRLLLSPNVAQQIRSLGAEPTPMSPSELRTVIDRDSKRYATIIKERGITEP